MNETKLPSKEPAPLYFSVHLALVYIGVPLYFTPLSVLLWLRGGQADLARVAGTWKYLGARKNERARVRHTYLPREARSFLRPTTSKHLLRTLTLIQFDVYTYGRHLI